MLSNVEKRVNRFSIADMCAAADMPPQNWIAKSHLVCSSAWLFDRWRKQLLADYISRQQERKICQLSCLRYDGTDLRTRCPEVQDLHLVLAPEFSAEQQLVQRTITAGHLPTGMTATVTMIFQIKIGPGKNENPNTMF